MNRTYQIHSLGCKTSQSDALSYAGLLQRAGWTEASGTQSASLIMVQTCTVTISADAQGRQLIRKLKREHPQSKILMTGCYAQRAEKELTQLADVDYVIGNLNPHKYEILSNIVGSLVWSEYADFPMPAESPRTRPYIKIQEGCDARCSYCIIPSVRGGSRSLPPEEVIRRVNYYRERGYKEMIFTGISMGGYGKDLFPKSSLSRLIRTIDALEGDFKIRLSSVEPEEVNDDFIDAFTSSRRFQPHLHLPLQSASDKVLKRMRRQYLFRHYDSIVNRIFGKIPDLNLGTDLLVGFPSEDQDAFEETLRYLTDAPFAYCHVFPFSPRPGTPAAAYAPAATNGQVGERAAMLRDVARRKNVSYRRQFLGRTLRALVLHGSSEALTDHYVHVRLCGPTPKTDIVSIRMNIVDEETTLGTIVN